MAEKGTKVTDFRLFDLFNQGNSRHYPKGQIMIYEGDPVSLIHYVKSGYIKIYNIQPSGSESIIFVYGPGDVFPLSTFLSGKRVGRYFYACMTDVELQSIPSEQLERRIKNDLVVGEALIGYVYNINEQFFERIETLSVNNAQRKIVALLGFLVEKVGSDKPMSELRLRLTQQDIANMSGLTRESTSRQLVSLKRQKLLLNNANGSIVIDVGKLNRRMEKLSIVI